MREGTPELDDRDKNSRDRRPQPCEQKYAGSGGEHMRQRWLNWRSIEQQHRTTNNESSAGNQAHEEQARAR
jgi:hypothetical protein